MGTKFVNYAALGVLSSYGGKRDNDRTTAVKSRWVSSEFLRSQRSGPDAAADRFWQHVDCSAGLFACWEWRGAHAANGYSRIGYYPLYAHREAFLLVAGYLPPKGIDLDHLCRNRGCVNPIHLDPVPHHENCRRGKQAQQTHCKHGHPFDAANTIIRERRDGSTYRQCRPCCAIRAQRQNAQGRVYHRRGKAPR